MMTRLTLSSRLTGLMMGLLTLAFAATALAAEPGKKEWLEKWQKQNPKWRALHTLNPRPELLPVTKQLITEMLGADGLQRPHRRSRLPL